MMHTSILSLVILVLICQSHSQFAGIRESFDGIRESFDGIREYFERWERLTVKGTRCIFPFVNGGVPFSNCARGVEQPFAWCATEVTDDKQWKDWEVCFPDPSDFLSAADFEQSIGDFLSPADFEQPIGDFLTAEDFEQPIDVCQLPFDVGPCRDLVSVFAFNTQTEKCESFIHGGCGGNENKFETEEDCIAMCNTQTVGSMSSKK